MTNDFVRASDGSPSAALNLVIKLYSINGHPAVKISDDLTKNTGDKDEVAYVHYTHAAWSSAASASTAESTSRTRSYALTSDHAHMPSVVTTVSVDRTYVSGSRSVSACDP